MLPPWDDTEYSDGAASSSSSYSSDATESVASETSADQLLSDGLAADLEGDNSFDDGNSSGDDDDDDDDDGDDDDNSSSDLEEPYLCQIDTAIFTPQGPWQGEDLSAEQQLRSLQCGEDKNNKILSVGCIQTFSIYFLLEEFVLESKLHVWYHVIRKYL